MVARDLAVTTQKAVLAGINYGGLLGCYVSRFRIVLLLGRATPGVAR